MATKYEIMYILSATLEEAKRNEIVESLHAGLKNNNTGITSVNQIGLKELAYEIDFQKRGYYVLLNCEADNDKGINEFDRLARINTSVLRHLIVRQ